MLSSLFESHHVPGQAMSKAEAEAEVERLKRELPPAEGF